METEIRIFYSYAHEDRKFMEELSKHLERFDYWHDGKILAGTDWAVEIEKNLNDANVFLLLISPNFMASEYCYKTEMIFALKKQKQGEAIIIPIILSSSHRRKEKRLLRLKMLLMRYPRSQEVRHFRV